MRNPEELFFVSLAKTQKIPLYLANKIIDGRYKPYLSNLDDQYYSGSLYDAKAEALMKAISKYGVKETIEKLKKIR